MWMSSNHLYLCFFVLVLCPSMHNSLSEELLAWSFFKKASYLSHNYLISVQFVCLSSYFTEFWIYVHVLRIERIVTKYILHLLWILLKHHFYFISYKKVQIMISKMDLDGSVFFYSRIILPLLRDPHIPLLSKFHTTPFWF